MATYIMLSTLTDDGRETISERPERIAQVNKEVEQLGARVVQQYAVLGPYDFVNVVEAPDNETIARVSVALGARGTVQFLTMPAIPVDQFTASLQQTPPTGESTAE
ncbi:MAG: GYD domain-containing protein [Chloroflexota bacterium]|nr:GYD domain-containing protein [Chloroflexota bacterium]